MPSTLEYYTQPGAMTSPGRFAPLFDDLPTDVASLAAIAQGVLIHEHLAGAYGVTITDDERATVHLRRVEDTLARIVAKDDRPLDQSRKPAGRVVGNCRHFTVLTAAMLRAQGRPARARCGFGAYFNDGMFEDHWVCEWWDDEDERWRLVDAQIDKGQRAFFPIDFDLTDVPRDRFVIAGDAWLRYRAGDVDPDLFGLSAIPESGAWWIAANLMRDAASLRNIELLPWDCWGAMPGPEDDIDDGLATLFDHLSTLTQSPDASFDELRDLLRVDDRLRVPATVRNALRDRGEPI